MMTEEEILIIIWMIAVVFFASLSVVFFGLWQCQLMKKNTARRELEDHRRQEDNLEMQVIPTWEDNHPDLFRGD